MQALQQQAFDLSHSQGDLRSPNGLPKTLQHKQGDTSQYDAYRCAFWHCDF